MKVNELRNAIGKYDAAVLTEIVVELYNMMIKFSLYEYDEGLNYYWKNFEEKTPEIKLYCLLCYFLNGDDERLDSLWIREYENAVARGIKPREALQNEYAQRIAEK